MATSPESATTSNSSFSDQTKLMADHLSRLLDLYKHHFDLFLKAVAGYLAVLGFIGGTINNSQTTHENRILLSTLISLASIFGVVGSVIAKRWVRTIGDKINDLCNRLQLPAPPLHSAEGILVVMIVLSAIFIVSGIGYAVYVRYGGT